MFNEPADVAFAIQQLTAATATKNSWLDGLIDKNAIVLAGHSDGGDVVAALVYDAAKRVPGITVRAVAVLSGAEFAIENQAYSQPPGPPVPLLVVQSMTDVCNPPSVRSPALQRDRCPEVLPRPRQRDTPRRLRRRGPTGIDGRRADDDRLLPRRRRPICDLHPGAQCASNCGRRLLAVDGECACSAPATFGSTDRARSTDASTTERRRLSGALPSEQPPVSESP